MRLRLAGFMKKRIKFMKRCISLFILAVLAAFNVFSADLNKSVFDFAKKLELNGEQEEALTEYKRYIFLQKYSEGDMLEQSYEGVVRCYFHLGNMDNALLYARRAKNETLELNLLMQKSLVYGDWEAFESNFRYAKNTVPDFFTEEEELAVINALSQYEDFSPKNPKLAAGLSVIPGLGQFYAGDYKDALNAFVLDGSLLALSAYSLFNFNFFDFVLLEASPTFRFYMGNFHNAKKDVKNYNSRKTSEIAGPVLEILRKKLVAY